LIGAVVHRIRELPWIADYRDLWFDNPYIRRGPMRRVLERVCEVSAVAQADKITTVAPGLAQSLRALHGRPDISVVPNAHDFSVWDNIPDLPPQDFRFCHAGRTYGGDRTPELVFRAVHNLKQRNHPAGTAARFDFYGPDSTFVSPLAERYGLSDAVTIWGNVDRAQVLQAERSAAVLLILVGNRAPSLPGSKVLEYAGARRPILAVGPAGSIIDQVLQETGLGVLVSSESACTEAVVNAYDRFKGGHYEPPLVRNDWSPWTARDMAREFAKLLDSIAE
jgi:glycosyltransferase involved in cell wall biosynthesis